ncbi:MAG: DUF4846 domain-containing protein [Bacteroidota bacterium]
MEFKAGRLLYDSMRNCIIFLFLLISSGCQQQSSKPMETGDPGIAKTPVYHTIGEIDVPTGYQRMVAEPGSFAAWLRTIPLKKDKTVYLYNGKIKPNQSAQFAVIDIPVGNKDLQQCADAVMRLRAEYQYAQKDFSGIAFMDYNNKWYKWAGEDNRPAFDNYLQNVFGWCGSASLEKQLRPVPDFTAMKAGDVFVKGGFPGHAMTVADMAIDADGKKIFLLVQGYQPAQDMHVVVNPGNKKLSPWYGIDDGEIITTPEWSFRKEQLKSW